MACPILIPDGAFASSVMSYVDCQALAIGESGYRALASTGSPVMMSLAGLLTILVALFGYRMVFGQVPQVSDLVAPVIKLGLVLTFLLSWSAYRTVIYDVTMRGPAELAGRIGDASDVAGTSGGLVALLQRVDSGLSELGRLGTGRQQAQVGPTPPQAQGQNGRRTGSVASAPTPPAFDQSLDRVAEANSLRQARTWFLLGTVGAFAIIRLFAGLLLALGPVFMTFLLFDATRDLVENWVRALGWTILGAIGVTLVVAIELAFLESWLASVLTLRRAALPSTANPAEFQAFTLIFAAVTLAVLVASGWVMRRVSLSLPSRWMEALRPVDAAAQPTMVTAPTRESPALAERSRALHIADAVTNMTRREASQPSIRRVQVEAGGVRESGRAATGINDNVSPGLAHHARRRTRNRVSTSATRRNGNP